MERKVLDREDGRWKKFGGVVGLGCTRLVRARDTANKQTGRKDGEASRGSGSSKSIRR